MTDKELRSKLLAYLYEQRSKNWTIVGSDARNSHEGREELRIARQLDESGLIELKVLNLNLGANVRINSHGVDVMEGNMESPVAITVDRRQTINISGSSAFQVGDGNDQAITLSIDAIIQKIDASEATVVQKSELSHSCQNSLSTHLYLQ